MTRVNDSGRKKPDRVIEHRISLQTKERELLEDLIASVQFKQLSSGAGSLFQGLGLPEITKQFKDPTQMIGVFYSIAMVLEFLGIETGLPTPADFTGWYQEYQQRRAQRPDEPKAGTLAMIVKDILVNLFGLSEEEFPQFGGQGL